MQFVITIAAFVVTLAILVTIHEFGHYWVARRCGIKVLTFSIGFGKPLFAWQRGDTQWQIAMFPLGGYVRMLDERETPVAEHERHLAFNTQHPLKKMAVVVAGPLANLLLAMLLYVGLYNFGVETIRPVIGQVQAGSIAASVGLHAGDEVIAVDGAAIASWDSLLLQILGVADQPTVPLTVRNAAGLNRVVSLPLTGLGKAVFDARLLDRLGLSPYPVTTQLDIVEPGSAAAAAGLKVGDRLLALDGTALSDWSQLQRALLQGGGKKIELLVARQEQRFTVSVQPVLTQPGRVGRLGVRPTLDESRWQSQQITLRYGLVDAFGVAAQKLWAQTHITLATFGHMFTGRASLEQVSGPLTIAAYAGESARLGFAAFVQYLAVISLSLAVLNLLPVPVLDGGHLMYHTAELLAGRPMSARAEAIGQRLGLVFLLALMVLALFNDFHRFLPG